MIPQNIEPQLPSPPKRKRTKKSNELAVRIYFVFGGFMDGFISNDLLKFNPTSITIKAPREAGERHRQSYTFEKGVVERVVVKGVHNNA